MRIGWVDHSTDRNDVQSGLLSQTTRFHSAVSSLWTIGKGSYLHHCTGKVAQSTMPTDRRTKDKSHVHIAHVCVSTQKNEKQSVLKEKSNIYSYGKKSGCRSC